jgi:lipoprotein-releasing system ATP-binding protein
MSDGATVREDRPAASGSDSAAEVLGCRGLERRFDDGGRELVILRGVNISVARGEMIAIMGRSGSGKSTLLHLLGLLDRPTAGEVFVGGVAAGGLSDRRRAFLRNRRIGFVFQSYHLMPEFTVLENILMPAMVAEGPLGWLFGGRKKHRERAEEILEAVGLKNVARKYPRTLSGGERQRVAIGRALLMRPDILLCDEPTGNLDPRTAGTIMGLLHELREKHGQTIVLVTHDDRIASDADRTMSLRDGVLSEIREGG